MQGEFKVQKEAVWMVANFTTGGSVDQLIQLVQAGVLEPLINLLTIPDNKMVIIILDILFFILQVSCSEQVGTPSFPSQAWIPRAPANKPPKSLKVYIYSGN